MVTLSPDSLQKKSPFERVGAAPLVLPLPPETQLSDAFLRLCHLPHCVWLDSAKSQAGLGRYSFLTADPVELLQPREGSSNPVDLLRGFDRFLNEAPVDGLPPFQGGLAGVFSYDLSTSLEEIPKAEYDDFSIPQMCVGFYDWVICYDHLMNQGWIVCQGWPEQDPTLRCRAAESRLRQIQWWLSRTPTALPQVSAAAARTPASPQFATPLDVSLSSNFAPGAYRDAVSQVVEYIRRGDVFQVNLAQRLLFPDRHGAASLYLRLRTRNPAPFAGYFDGGSWQVISASPERFLSVQGARVQTRPIKGTCPRTGDEIRDKQFADELLNSQKDRAENIMIVDLMRNDLSRVCTDSSIQVSQLCGLEQYECVQHLVSVVEGELRPHRSVADLIQASFPGGSITGAPKVRAMEIISELEPTARGPYCGSLGYISTGQTTDLNILIRTAISCDGWLQIPVGGGITARSDPAREEQETWDKAEGMLRAVL